MQNTYMMDSDEGNCNSLEINDISAILNEGVI